MALCAKPRKIAKLFKTIKEYATAHEIKCFSLDAAGRTFSQGKLWNFGISYTDNSINWIDILKRHCTDTETDAHYKEFGDIQNLDWFFNYLRSTAEYRIETFYVENLLMIHNHLNIYSMPIWGVRYWSKGKCHWPAMINEFGMGEAGSLPIPDDIIKFDIGLTLAECRHFIKIKSNPQTNLMLYEFANKYFDSEITMILPIADTTKNIEPCFQSLLKQMFDDIKLSDNIKFVAEKSFKAFRLIVTDAGLNEEALKTCREMESKFVGRMKIITGLSESDLLSAGLKAAKGRYVLFINGNDIFIPNAFQTFHEIAEISRADVVHLSNYLVSNSNGTFSIKTNEPGWGENMQTINVLQRFNDKFGAWARRMLSPSIYNKFIRREFIEEEKISLNFNTEITQWLFSLQCLLLAERYVRVAQPLYIRTVEEDSRKVDFKDFDITAKSSSEGIKILDKLADEIFYFEEYAPAKELLNDIYKNLIKKYLNDGLA